MSKYLPKTGETCLVNFHDIDERWEKYTIDFIGNHVVVVSKNGTPELCLDIESLSFKPIAYEIGLMLEVVDGLNDNYDCCKALYDAGYRKVSDANSGYIHIPARD